MSLHKQLAHKKAAICAKWFEALTASYPADTARFLKGTQDPFANPVGQNSRQSLETLLDLILEEYNAEKAAAALDVIIRIRAIQNFTPAQAVRFVFELKAIIHSHAGAAAGEAQWRKAMTDIENRIDVLAMAAFDIYVSCREKIYELKANEVRSKTFKAFA
ncbi:MAG: RsbRD N-terminal domain-containing protein, partial [Desulfosarcinaceae bacterium]